MRNRLAVFLIGMLAAVLLGACAAGSQQATATPVTDRKTGAAAGGTGTKTDAVAAFNRLLPVLQSPRCANCHGAMFVFEPDPKRNDHMGGVMAFVDEPRTWDECQECHTRALEERKRLAASGRFPEESRVIEESAAKWQQPLYPPARWGGKPPSRICRALKESFPNPGRLIEHLNTDILVYLGFEGKRGQADLLAEPPPMTQAQFSAAVGDWLKAMGAEEQWPQDPNIGCPAPEPTPTAAPTPTPTKGPAVVKYVLTKTTVDCQLIESGFTCSKGTDTATVTRASQISTRTYVASPGKVTMALRGVSAGDYDETITWNALPSEIVPGQDYTVTLHTTYTRATGGAYAQSKASFCCPQNHGQVFQVTNDPTGGQTYFTIGPNTDFVHSFRLNPAAIDPAKLPKTILLTVTVPPGQFSGVVVRYEYQLAQ
jgi:hypothetical protein